MSPAPVLYEAELSVLTAGDLYNDRNGHGGVVLRTPDGRTMTLRVDSPEAVQALASFLYGKVRMTLTALEAK